MNHANNYSLIYGKTLEKGVMDTKLDLSADEKQQLFKIELRVVGWHFLYSQLLSKIQKSLSYEWNFVSLVRENYIIACSRTKIPIMAGGNIGPNGPLIPKLLVYLFSLGGRTFCQPICWSPNMAQTSHRNITKMS